MACFTLRGVDSGEAEEVVIAMIISRKWVRPVISDYKKSSAPKECSGMESSANPLRAQLRYQPTQQRAAEEHEPPRALAATTSPLPPARRYNTTRTYVATTKAATSN
ncbi:hypothetical protein HPB52_005411 [Rhipicephalus sanguineus]|uniref:Uncharacterized protein n=1 Tax=Rhipicephalus sanguineus TaxID=34632 RepID=A0A9D4Q9R7_RHISA|nr:hypothetical protein HPB52_005411 [Rhipicephalus sanguineus]